MNILQDSRAVIDAKSAGKFVVDKLAEMQRAVETAAKANAALVNAKLVEPDVRSFYQPSCFRIRTLRLLNRLCRVDVPPAITHRTIFALLGTGSTP